MPFKKYPSNEYFLKSVYELGKYLRTQYKMTHTFSILCPPPQGANGGILYLDLLDYPIVAFEKTWSYTLRDYPFHDPNKKLETIDMNLPLEVSLFGRYDYKKDKIALKLFEDYDSRIRKIFNECFYETQPITYRHESDLVNKIDVRMCQGVPFNTLVPFEIKYIINRNVN